ncbi:MAG: tetratricopeptide repeat protein [Proteobacteria bacterium]|nr:tetratricopeptide repeat protein [Pseudomonadota bacterium]MBU1716894.1 tetratricopeptide repeat protein [Pseudomonadota bacterium]
MKIHKSENLIHLFLLPALVLLILTTLTYANSFQTPFSFDDEQNITENHALRINKLSWNSLHQLTTRSPLKHRWLPNLSFGLNYYFHGYEVFGYHLVNLAIHLLTAFLLYGLSFTTLILPQIDFKPRAAMELSLIAALLWAVHPLQTNAVTYLVQRMTSMAAFFYLAALLCYVRGRLAFLACRSLPEKQKHPFPVATFFPIRSYLWWTGSLLCGLAAMLSKENSAMLVLIIPAYEFYFLRNQAKKTDYKIIVPSLLITFVVLYVVGWLYLGTNPFTAITHGFGGRDFTMLERLLTESRIIFHYLGLILLPLPSRLNLAYDYQISHSLLAPPQTLLALLGIIGLLVLTAYLFKRHKLLSFGLFWFLANLAIESTILPLELIFEHRLYLPSTMLILAGVVGLAQIFAQRQILRRLFFALVIMFLCLGTWQRNKVWASEISLWSDVVKKSPNLGRGYANLGRAHEMAGNHLKAISILREAIRLDHKNGTPWLNLGRSYERLNLLTEAKNCFEQALGHPNVSPAKIHNNLAIIYIKLDDLPRALTEAAAAIQFDPLLVDPWLNQGVVFGLLGRHQLAEKSFRQGLNLDPRDGRLYQRLAFALAGQNQIPAAIAALDQALICNNMDMGREAMTRYRQQLLRKIQ